MRAKDKERVQRLNPMDDDFLKKMAEDTDFCQEVISIATGNKALKVISYTSQKWVKNLQGRSVVLDIVCEDEQGTLILVEVQKADDDDHVRRVRYNTSCITANVTMPGERFKEIKDIISIYITKNDFIGEQFPKEPAKAVYHVDRMVRETGKILDNGITEIYINAKIKDNSDASKLMRVFLENDAYDYEVCPVTSKRKYYLKNTDKGVEEMCVIMDEVRAEGIEKGRVEGIIHMAGTLLKHNLSEEYIISVLQEELNLTKEEAREFFAERVAGLQK